MTDKIPCPLEEAAREAPREMALLSREMSLTFSELHTRVEKEVFQLHQWGIGSGDRIATRGLFPLQRIALLFAAWRLGASVCPLHEQLTALQVEESLSRLSPKLFFTREEVRFFKSSQEKNPPSLFLFTSGSTGRPKIAVLSRQSLLASASSALTSLDFQRGDRWLLSLPLYHVGGIEIALRCILGRGTIALDERDPSITHLSYVPTQLYRAWPLYRNLKCCLLGGAPVFSFPERLPVFVTYGLTEMASLVTVRKHPPKIGDLFYLGAPLPGREVKLSAEGEIWMKGECLFEGYWEEGCLVPSRDEEGWFATRDLGKWDAKEGLAITGRKDGMFISGGENIQPEEIERYLFQIPGVLDAVVVPIPDPEFGMRPIAFVRTVDAPLNLHQMQERLKPHLPKYKIPVALFPLENFPQQGGKIERKKILEFVRRQESF